MISMPEKLSSTAITTLENGNNEIFLSAISGLEIAIKCKIGRLKLLKKPEIYIPEQMNLKAIQMLPVSMSHSLNVYNLPDIHKDPFDRLLISQMQLENLPIITDDEMIKKYEVRVVW